MSGRFRKYISIYYILKTTGTTMKTTPAVVVGDLRRGAKARLPNSPPKHNILDILGYHPNLMEHRGLIIPDCS